MGGNAWPGDRGLSVEAVSVRRGGRTVVDRVSFAVHAGEIVALIGPNGAGKTSLLEAVVGLLPVAHGRVQYGDRVLSLLGDRARVFAFLADAAEPPAEVRVGSVIDSLRRHRGDRSDGDAELLAALGLARLRQARIGELSRGERRRLALLGALVLDRPVVVLDEPLGVFDPLQLIDVLDVLRRRARGGSSFLISIHQMSDAEKIASRIVLLDAGSAIAVGSLTELRERLGCPSASLEDVFVGLLRSRDRHAAS